MIDFIQGAIGFGVSVVEGNVRREGHLFSIRSPLGAHSGENYEAP